MKPTGTPTTATPGAMRRTLLKTTAATAALGLLGAPAIVRAPYTYTALVWAMLLGLAVFGNFPDAGSLAGMAVIVASGLFIANRQRLTVRRG